MCSLRENIHDFTRTAIIYIGLLQESSEKIHIEIQIKFQRKGLKIIKK